MPQCLLVVTDRYSISRRLEEFFSPQCLSSSSIRLRDGDVNNVFKLWEIPLAGGDVGHYDKKLSATSSLVIFDWPCDAEGLNILAWSHEFSKLYFSCG